MLILILFMIIGFIQPSQAKDHHSDLENLNKLIPPIPREQTESVFNKLKKEHPCFYASVTVFVNAPGIGRDQIIQKLLEGDFLEKKLGQLTLEETVFFIRDIRSYWNKDSLITIFKENPEKYEEISNKFFEIIKAKKEFFKIIKKANNPKQTLEITSPQQKYLPSGGRKPFLNFKHYDAFTVGTNHQLTLS